INETLCHYNYCQNNGTCVYINGYNETMCKCRNGTYGSMCETVLTIAHHVIMVEHVIRRLLVHSIAYVHLGSPALIVICLQKTRCIGKQPAFTPKSVLTLQLLKIPKLLFMAHIKSPSHLLYKKGLFLSKVENTGRLKIHFRMRYENIENVFLCNSVSSIQVLDRRHLKYIPRENRTAINETLCHYNYCQNNGTCVYINGYNETMCKCRNGTYGSMCETVLTIAHHVIMVEHVIRRLLVHSIAYVHLGSPALIVICLQQEYSVEFRLNRSKKTAPLTARGR
ncbi:unnamed protein product, partial [Didymodactylos carnosus]